MTETFGQSVESFGALTEVRKSFAVLSRRWLVTTAVAEEAYDTILSTCGQMQVLKSKCLGDRI